MLYRHIHQQGVLGGKIFTLAFCLVIILHFFISLPVHPKCEYNAGTAVIYAQAGGQLFKIFLVCMLKL